MIDSNKFKVLFYSDGSQQSLSAAVYTATLFNNMSNIQLTIVQVKETDRGSRGIEYSWKELSWIKHVSDKADLETKNHYEEILTQTNEIFLKRGHDVNQQVIYSNTSICDTAKAILGYATNYGYELIIIGTRRLTGLKGFIHWSLVQSILNKSDIPVLVK